jgi:hypothetical protein
MRHFAGCVALLVPMLAHADASLASIPVVRCSVRWRALGAVVADYCAHDAAPSEQRACRTVRRWFTGCSHEADVVTQDVTTFVTVPDGGDGWALHFDRTRRGYRLSWFHRFVDERCH